MAQTLADNITRKVHGVHECGVFISDSPDSEGDKLKDIYSVKNIVVGVVANKIAYAKIKLADGSVPLQDFELSNEADFEPGKFITIKMGDVNEMESVFQGVIVKHGIKISRFKGSSLTIDCRDVAVATTTIKRSKYFAEKTTDSDAISEILGEYTSKAGKAISPSIEDIEVEHEGLVQYNCTDWEFILKRAHAAGQLVYTNMGELITITPTVGASAEFTLTYGNTISEFEAEMDIRDQFSEVKMNIWDSAKQELTEEEGSSTGAAKLDDPGDISNTDLAKVINEEGNLINYPGQLVDGDLKNAMKAELIKSKLARIKGRVSFVGATVVPVQSTIELKGVGNRFNGLTYVTGARYEFANNIWTTNLQFGLSPDWNSQALKDKETVINSRIPVMGGLYIGTVTRLDDESGEDRIQVRIPVIDKEAEGIWAKMARPDAGEHRGLFYLPEVDDEVLVGFLNGDPRYPVILGMLHSSAMPAPVEAKEEDNLKGYYSKVGSRVEFDDKKRTLKIQTMDSGESGSLEDFRTGEPELEKNNTILLDDENGTLLIQDKNKNYIQMDEEGILIFADKKITLESKEISIIATDKLVTDTKASELVSSGETKIKGATINLNP